MTLREHVESYYDALRAGAPLAPFFAPDSTLVKFGIHERLEGADAVERGLREQTEHTTDWTVTSHRLRTDTHGAAGWFSDLVFLAWTDRRRDQEFAFDTRWSGTALEDGDRWRFTGMHVSVPYAFADERVEARWIEE